jgi:hypothetical protein
MSYCAWQIISIFDFPDSCYCFHHHSLFKLPQSQDVAGSDSVKDGLPLVPLKESRVGEKLLLSFHPIAAKGISDMATLEEVQLVRSSNKV